MPPATFKTFIWCVLVLAHITHPAATVVSCWDTCACANVCKLIMGVGWRLGDIFRNRGCGGVFLVVVNEFSTWRVYNEPSYCDSMLWIMEQLINEGTETTLDAATFIHLAWGMIQTGVEPLRRMVCDDAPISDVAGSLHLTHELLLNKKRDAFFLSYMSCRGKFKKTVL